MTRRIGLTALAVVLALAGTFAVYLYAHQADQRAVAATKATTVVYARSQIPAGTSWADALKAGQLATESVPTNAAPAQALHATQGAMPGEQVANAAVGAGQIVVRSMFGAKKATTGLLQIPGSNMAISVSVPSNAEVAGFVQPGSQVAVFMTYNVGQGDKQTLAEQPGSGSGTGADHYATKMLLPRADVLAVSQGAPTDLNGSQASASLSSSQASGNVLVTLSLTQKDAERLVLAQQVGDLYMALLSQSSTSATDGGTSNQMHNAPTQIFVQ